jgi:hypothetical protein
MTGRVANVLASIGAAVVTYRSAGAADALVLRIVPPPRGEVLLLSDAILATALGVVYANAGHPAAAIIPL